MWVARPGQEDTRRRNHPPVCVTPGPVLDDGRSGLKRASAQFGTAEIHVYATLAPCLQLGPLQIREHPGPLRWTIMGAVNPHAIHSIDHQVTNQSEVTCRIGRHGHHNPHGTVLRWWAQKSVSVAT